ncbi:MAG: type II toxin-antitoxin system RelE/ParE family toxin [Paludibacteraceae bacterium]|nr:type II toxin-antitoxin system RelE/ParE family toxin [Paludibacteraceae bacterium]
MAQIIWHDSAKEHLADIFTYYMDNVSQQVAYSFLHSILTGVESLANMPRKGARELLLANRKYEYRHLVIRRNYKIIYFIDNEECHIVAIWDTRQKPTTLIAKVTPSKQ